MAQTPRVNINASGQIIGSNGAFNAGNLRGGDMVEVLDQNNNVVGGTSYYNAQQAQQNGKPLRY